VASLDFRLYEEPAIILKKKEDTKPTLWFEVDDVKAEVVKLKEKGLTFLAEPFEINTGMAVEFEDPFGNQLGMTDYTKMKNK
jgi:predicted enzyme related to lactoylglutathione lyase